ncbi:hypothetical protein [Candidatus Pelagibacter communis]|uniref:hypothetical protein n=1 Tax=Candidatus Pelagibacter TaxID=198251 RepID=UPI003EE11086
MSKIDLDEIYNPSHKLKSNIYKAIQQQSLDNKKNKLFKNDILNSVKEKKDPSSSKVLFEKLTEQKIIENEKSKKIKYIIFGSAVLLVFSTYFIN